MFHTKTQIFTGLFFFFTCINLFSLSGYKTGDILFVSKAVSDFEDAVVGVTQTENQVQFSHVGLLNATDSGIYIIEANQNGVVYTPIDSFFVENGKENIYLARLKPDYEHFIPEAIHFACLQIGKNYDYAFDLENDQYYCSELIYYAFATASQDTAFFELTPMTFKNPDTQVFLPFWINYYQQLKLPIPEGKLGLNPNGMSLSNKLIWVK